jgi:hypothetical protein
MTLKLNGSSSGYTAIDAPAAAGSNTLVLPADNGSANEVLKTDGSGNLDWVAQPTGGISEFDQWRLTANTSGDHDPLSTNLERVDTDGFAAKGSGMSVASGIWTFPSTGWWLCDFTFLFYANASTDGNMYGNIQVTPDNATYTDRLEIVMFAAANDHGVSGNGKLILDVTNVSNVKLKIKITQANNSDMIQGNTARNLSHFTFLKLAET